LSTRALSPLGKTITDAVLCYSEHLIASDKQSKAPLTDAIGRFLDAKEAKGIKISSTIVIVVTKSLIRSFSQLFAS